MALSLPVGSLVLFTIESRCFEQTAISTFGYQVSVVSGAGDLATEANNFLNYAGTFPAGTWIETYRELLAQNSTVTKMTWQGVYPTRWARFSKALLGAGQRLDDCTAPNVSGVLVRRGIKGRKRDISTLHMPWIAASDYLDGELQLAYNNTLDLLGARLKANITVPAGGGVYRPVILSFRKYPGEPAIDITNTFVQPQLRVMRQRTVGRGI